MLSERVRRKNYKNNEAEITWEQLIMVCQIANGALEHFIQNNILWLKKQ